MQIKFPTEKVAEGFSFKAFFWREKERVLLALVVLTMGSFLLVKSFTSKERVLQGYLQAALFQSKIKGYKEVEREKLLKLLDQYPDLNPLFSAYLEETFSLEGDMRALKRLAESSLKRISFVDSHYLEYAAVSLLIEEGLYEEALRRTKELAQGVDVSRMPYLYGLNVMRMAFLEKSLAKECESRKLWDEVKGVMPAELYAHLKDDHLSLLDFLQMR